MEIIKTPDLPTILKDNYLLLDTNIFINAFVRPKVFGDFFTELKTYNLTIFSLELVTFEFLKGTINQEKYSERKIFLEQQIDGYLPITNEIINNAYRLLSIYGVDGKSLSITDLILGAHLMEYPKRLFLLTKNTTDFPMNIFTLASVIHIPLTKSIQTYGLYTYNK